MRVLSSPNGITILNVEEFRDEQSSVGVWLPAQCLKPETFHVRSEGLNMHVTEVVAPIESLITFEPLSWTRVTRRTCEAVSNAHSWT